MLVLTAITGQIRTNAMHAGIAVVGWVITSMVGLMPATYQPSIGRVALRRLAIALGSALVLGAGAGLLASLGWSARVGVSVGLVAVGIVVLIHHALWAWSSRRLMFLWPGIAAAGSSVLFGSVLVSSGSLVAQPIVLVGIGLFVVGASATFFNVGA